MYIILTKHAKLKMVEYAVTKEQVKDVIKMGAKFKQTDGFLASYGYIKIAYKKIGEDAYKIKTVMIK